MEQMCEGVDWIIVNKVIKLWGLFKKETGY